jgi:hypothetical protein
MLYYMKFSKFVNKKMIIFVGLFIAFIYFSGIFHYMREGLTPGTKIIKDMDCSGCHISLTNPKCNTKCSPNIKYKQLDCLYNGKDTMCKPKRKSIPKRKPILKPILKPIPKPKPPNTLLKEQVKK